MSNNKLHKEQTFIDSLDGKPSINLQWTDKKKQTSLEPESFHKVYGVGLFLHLVASWHFNLILAQMSDVLQSEPLTLFCLVFRETFSL